MSIKCGNIVHWKFVFHFNHPYGKGKKSQLRVGGGGDGMSLVFTCCRIVFSFAFTLYCLKLFSSFFPCQNMFQIWNVDERRKLES